MPPLSARALSRASELSRYPSVRRDLAFVVADEVPWAAIAATVRTAAGPLLRDILLFDRYVGQGVESGQKSLAMGLILQDNSRTLTDRDVEQVVATVVAAIGEAHGGASCSALGQPAAVSELGDRDGAVSRHGGEHGGLVSV